MRTIFESQVLLKGVVTTGLAGTLALAGCSAKSPEPSHTEGPTPVTTHLPNGACEYPLPEGYYSQANVVVLGAGTVVLRHDNDTLQLSHPGIYDLTASHSDSAANKDTAPDGFEDWANWVNSIGMSDNTKVTLYNNDSNTDPKIALPAGSRISLTCEDGTATPAY